MNGTNFLTAKEVSEICGVSLSKSYRIISTLNEEMRRHGYFTIAGKINRRFFEDRVLYGGKVNAPN